MVSLEVWYIARVLSLTKVGMDLGRAPESAGSLAQGDIVLSANVAAAVVVLGSHGAWPSQLRNRRGT